MEEFWISQAKLYSDEKFEINELGTHPALLRAFRSYEHNWKQILDYGCGDGSLIQKLDPAIEVSLFDTSKSMLRIAERKLRNMNPTVYEDASRIPLERFDCIFLSMVLICVDSESEVDFIIDRLAETKKKEGFVFVANPHPCFRDRPFSSYYTDFSVGRPFNYFDAGAKHRLIVRGKPMKFYDYNWSVSFVLNRFIDKGLTLVEMIEIEDNKTNEYYNPNHSPSIIYVFK